MKSVERTAVEDFLFAEATMLDEWRLQDWLELFEEDAMYVVPGTDLDPTEALTVDPLLRVGLVADDRLALVSRVRRLLDLRAHAENPRSRTRHLVGNVRVVAEGSGEVRVRAVFSICRWRKDAVDLFTGQYVHRLVLCNGSFRFAERRAVLDCESVGAISFIL